MTAVAGRSSHRKVRRRRVLVFAVPLVHAELIAVVVVLTAAQLRHSDGTGARAYGPALAQASGLAALTWAYAALLLGLLVSTRQPGAHGHRPDLHWRAGAVTVHRQLSVAVIALTLAHALLYALATPAGSLLSALVPWTAGDQQLGYTLGVLALYLFVLLGPSYYLRDRIGRWLWLAAHQLVAVSYALSLWHALYLGTDLRGQGILRTVLWIAQLPLLALLVIRLARPMRRSDELDPARRKGRFAGRRHVVSRLVLVAAVSGTFAIIFVMTLLALSTGSHGTVGLGISP